MVDGLDSVLQVIATVKSGLADQLTAASRIEDLRLDSLDEVEILMALEDAHDIEIDQAQVKSCATLGDLGRLVDVQKSRKAGA